MSDIHTILQLLQRQPTLGPPAYSTVTASPDYHRPAVKVQPVALTASHFFSHTGTQVREVLGGRAIVTIFAQPYTKHCISTSRVLKSCISWLL